MQDTVTTPQLIEELNKAGIIHSETLRGGRNILSAWVKRGVLELRRMPHNGYFVVYADEVPKIIKELSPGGSGKYSYKN